MTHTRTADAGANRPIEIITPDELESRVEAGGVLTVTHGATVQPVAHRTDCPSVRGFSIGPRPHGRYWWTPDLASAQELLGARRCRQCGQRP